MLPPLDLPNDRTFFERHRIATVDTFVLPRLLWPYANKYVTRINTGETGMCRICIFTPNSLAQVASKSRGVIVHFHGGGWTISRPEAEAQFCRFLCERLGVIVVAPDYRKAPRHPYPHALTQCYAVLYWIASGELSHYLKRKGIPVDIETKRIALSGASAGSNLAASLTLLCLERPLPQGSNISALGLLYPVLNLDLPYEEKLARVDPSRVLPPWISRLFLTAYLPPPRSTSDPYVSPALARPSVLAKFPSTIILTAAYDYLAHEADEFADRLHGIGVKVKHKRFLHVGHAFDGLPARNRKQRRLNNGARDEAWSMIVIAFREALGGDVDVIEVAGKDLGLGNITVLN